MIGQTNPPNLSTNQGRLSRYNSPAPKPCQVFIDQNTEVFLAGEVGLEPTISDFRGRRNPIMLFTNNYFLLLGNSVLPRMLNFQRVACYCYTISQYLFFPFIFIHGPQCWLRSNLIRASTERDH